MILEFIFRTPFDTISNRTSFEIRRYDYTGSYRVTLCTNMYNNNDDFKTSNATQLLSTKSA